METDFFKGKRVTILGLGLLGRGVGDAAFIAERAAHVLITDRKSTEELAESVEKLRKYPNVLFHLGGHDTKDCTDTDMVVKAAGVPLDSPEVAAARDAGVPVYMSTALFAKWASEAGARIVGITGTRGKSTVAHMIHHALVRTGTRAHLGGNIRGRSTLALLPDVQSGDICVLELDSWQLQGFGDLKFSPDVAVFTNLMPDHQNYYPDMETYFADKANIFRFQKEGDVLFVGEEVVGKIQMLRPPSEAVVPPAVPADWTLQIPGTHNRENAAFAAAALRALGLSDEEVQSGLESFTGVEGRLQLVREINGVKIYNDNNATTPEATTAALRAVGNPQKRSIVLIMGGDDKGLDMSALIEEIPRWCSSVVLFKERGTDRIRDRVFALESEGITVYEEEGLSATVQRALSIARPGEIILFSPAFSSFGTYYKNEFDRNDQFLRLIKNI